jgi:hypothetical protein
MMLTYPDLNVPCFSMFVCFTRVFQSMQFLIQYLIFDRNPDRGEENEIDKGSIIILIMKYYYRTV